MTDAAAGAGNPGPPRRRAVRGRAGPAALLPLALLASGCAGLFGSYRTGPDGLSAHDHDLRTLLRRGSYDSALARVTPDRSGAGDELLRLQNRVVVAHHAGRAGEGAAALEEALVLADDRYTRSVSRAVLSTLTNDRILPYRPPPTERLLLHYYGALLHLRLEGASGAAVEARRLESRLQRAEEEGAPTGARRDLHVALHRFAGTLFEAAGEHNDAAVSHRRAARLAGGGPGEEEAGSPLEPPVDAVRDPGVVGAAAPAGAADPTAETPRYGEVLLAVEQGFVAHRVERSLNVLVWPEEMRRLASARDSADEERRFETALSVARRALRGGGDRDASGGEEPAAPRASPATDPADCGSRVIPGVGRVLTGCRDALDRPSRRRAARDLEGSPRLLRVAWPEYRPGPRPSPVRVRTTGEGGPRRRWDVDLSAAVVEEFGERAPEVLAKALLRAVVKNVLAGEVEEEVEEEDETLGEVAGVALNVLGFLTERADTRSWNLLPGRIRLVRLRLPAGEHRLALTRGAEGREPVETVDVRVPAGGVAVASVRLWR